MSSSGHNSGLATHAATQDAVVVEGLERRFGTVQALRSMSFRVARGEIFGLVGPDGAGKTTTLRIVAGLMQKDAGTVRVLGQDPADVHTRNVDLAKGSVRDRLGLVPQEHSLYGDLSVDENFYFFAELYGIPKQDIPERREKLLGITRLLEFGARRAQNLSGGMYKKLALACALLHRPEVLLLDEPTNGVDPVSRRELWNLLYDFVSEGTTVVVTTPYMDEAARCHRVALVHQGRVAKMGNPSELVRNLPARVFEVVSDVPVGLEDTSREAIHQVLANTSDVIAASPAGSRLRIVTVPTGEERVRAALTPLGVRLVASAPDFEDVFLWETHVHRDHQEKGLS